MLFLKKMLTFKKWFSVCVFQYFLKNNMMVTPTLTKTKEIGNQVKFLFSL